jgi:hypothetical protein
VTSTRAKSLLCAVGYVALGAYLTLSAHSQLFLPISELQHSLRGDVVSMVVRPRSGKSEGRIEFHLRNGEVWTYASYLPHYRSVASLDGGSIGGIELGVDPRGGRDYLRGYLIRDICEIRVFGRPLVTYHEVAASARRNSLAVTYMGAALMLVGIAIGAYEFLFKRVA